MMAAKRKKIPGLFPASRWRVKGMAAFPWWSPCRSLPPYSPELNTPPALAEKSQQTAHCAEKNWSYDTHPTRGISPFPYIKITVTSHNVVLHVRFLTEHGSQVTLPPVPFARLLLDYECSCADSAIRSCWRIAFCERR